LQVYGFIWIKNDGQFNECKDRSLPPANIRQTAGLFHLCADWSAGVPLLRFHRFELDASELVLLATSYNLFEAECAEYVLQMTLYNLLMERCRTGCVLSSYIFLTFLAQRSERIKSQHLRSETLKKNVRDIIR